MRAVTIDKFGDTKVLNVTEFPQPEISSNEVLINIFATSVNPADCKMRQGFYPINESFKFPYILGRDFSGQIEACGEKVTDFKLGDHVFGVLPAGREGTYLEKLAIDANLIARKPKSLSHYDAAAIALTGLTALVSIEDNLELQSGENILIHGGAGGVGSYAVQLANYLGANVITTASSKNHDYLYNLGANKVIDYNTEDFNKTLSNIDVAFDLIGGEVHERTLHILNTGGRIAYIAPLTKDAGPPRSDIQVIRPNVKRDRAHLLRIIELFELGAVVAPEIRTFPLENIREAHELVETNHVRGKVIIKIK
ncbi:NADP-dependent oxidoreductase [Gammaproteobacteria bacterium]|nr:NADP-dependent oxidoreductase [Gammaproteobacteria bacterium]